MLTPLLAIFFGTPLSVLVTAAGAVSIPVIIHLLNRRRYRVVTWAAMRFLLAAQKKNSRRLRVEQLLLLLVRIFIVLLVILAMAAVTGWAEKLWAQTFSDDGLLAAPGGRRTHRIIVLDGSLSMGLKVDDATCFEKARKLAIRLVQESPRGDGFSIVLMASSPRRLVGGNVGPAEDASRVISELEAIRLPHGNSDLAGTLETVANLIKQSPGKFVEKEVYFLTDLQKTSWALPQPKDVDAALASIRDNAHTILLDVGQLDPPPNRALTRFFLDPKRPFTLTGQETTFQGVIHNYGEETPDKVGISWRVGMAAQKAGDSSFAFGDETPLPLGKLSRGDNNFSFKHTFQKAGDYAVQVHVEGDALDLDDERTLIVRVRDSVQVVVVNGKPAADLYDEATEYLLDALNPFPGRPTAYAPLLVKKLSAAEFGRAEAGVADLTDWDCVFLCDVPRLSFSETRRLEGHVLRGGGVVFCLGPSVDLAGYNDVLFRGGQGLLPARLLGRQREPKGHHFRFWAEERDWKLPPLAPFDANENHRNNLLEAPFHEFIRAEAASPPGGYSARRVLSFITVPDRPEAGKPAEGAYQREPALLEWQPLLPARDKGEAEEDAVRRSRMPIPASRGRVALFTSTVNTDWTDWPRKGSFIWLMQELLGHVASARLRGQASTVGDTLEHYLPGSSGADEKEVTIYTPDGRKEQVRTTSREEAALWCWSDTDVSGVYRAVIGSHPREYLFAVNPPVASERQQGSESDLTRISPDELHKLYPEWDFQVVRDTSEAVKDRKKKLLGSSNGEFQDPQLGAGIARWLLLLAFILIVAECLLAWYCGHYTSIHEREQGADWLRGSALVWLRTGVICAMSLLGTFIVVTAGVLIHAALTGDFLGFLPGSWRSGIENLMEVPEPAPGEGSHWKLDYRPYLLDAGTDLWLAPLLALAVGALVVWLYLREGRVMGPASPLARRSRLVILCAMRIGLVLVMLVVLMPQLRLWFERRSWPDVVLLIDDSASMSEVDRYRDPKVQEIADKLGQLSNIEKPQRLQLAQALLTHGDEDWITKLLTRRQAKIHVYHCSARAARLQSVTQPSEKQKAIDAIRDLEARQRNDSSQLGAAVRQVLNDFRGSLPAAIVMFTDGVTTEGEDLGQVSKYAAQLRVPLFFVGLGDAHESRDIFLSDLEVADSVFVNDNLIFRFNVTVKGYGDQVGAVRVRLREKGSDKELASQVVTADTSGKAVKVRMEHRPTTPGEKTFVLDTDIRPDEVNKDNNKIERTVWVSPTRTIKVLYVEGYGRWEFRALKTLLERESDRIKNNKTMDLKFWLQDADPQFPLQDKNAEAELPDKGKLNQFDVVILGDVDPNPQNHPKVHQFLKDLADFVRERGGGLVMVAGERYTPQAYKDSPLRDVLPIDITSDKPPEEPADGRTDSFHPELTAVGRMHPIFSFNEKDNEPVWKKLRDMYWHAEGYQPKRAAEVLAVHPTKKMAGQGGKESRLPLVVQQFVGEGRTLFLGFGETWRWRWREDEVRFNQFWIQTVRYLARSRQGRVELRLDRQTPYLRGEPIKVTVRFPDDDKPPAADTDVRVLVINKDLPDQRTMKLARVDGSRATFEGTLTQTPEGRYEFWLSRPVVKPQPRAETKVLAPPGEMQRLQMNQAEMMAAALETQGRFFTLENAEQLIDALPEGPRVTAHAPGPPWLLWNHALLLLIVLLFLGVEWIMRKRFHLL